MVQTGAVLEVVVVVLSYAIGVADTETISQPLLSTLYTLYEHRRRRTTNFWGLPQT